MAVDQTSLDKNRLLQDIDRLIAEMIALREQVAAVKSQKDASFHSIRETEYFGMWADRGDMKGQTSREWLEKMRQQQWARP